ncbi:MAG: TIGR03016 family PEP-CTERM system-associated outer membrane protein [Betaproteobacteria bacterium]
MKAAAAWDCCSTKGALPNPPIMAMAAMAEVRALGMARGKTLRQRSASVVSDRGFENPSSRVRSTWCIALSVLLACPAWAAKWEIGPTLSAEETYTDNVRLSSTGTKESDWVTTISPRLFIRGTGDRLRLDFDYSPQFVQWAQEGNSRFFQSYVVSGTAEFVKQTLMLDARFAESQQTISIVGPRADSNATLTENRASVRTALVSPVLRHDFGSDAKAEARLSYSIVSSGANTALSDSRATAVDMKIDSGPAYKLLTWNAAYHRERVDYDDSQVESVGTEKLSGSVKRLITPQVALVATGGYEDNSYSSNGPATKGLLWSVGAEWNPSPRTRLSANLGRRYFGSTRSVDFSHRTRLTAWTVTYIEDVTTARSQFLLPTTADTAAYLNALFLSSIPDPIARQAAVNDFIARNGLSPNLNGPVNFFSNVPFLSKRLGGTFGILGVKNSVLATLFSETREALASAQPGEGEFSASGKTRQLGTSVLWTAGISAQTSASLGLGTTRTEVVAAGRKDTDKYVRFGLTHQFQPKLSGSLFFRRFQNDSSASGTSYTANSVSATILAKF